MFFLNEPSIEWAKKHLITFYDSDFFPRATEFIAIQSAWQTIKDHILSLDLSDYTPKSPRMLLVPKSGNSFRIVHQLEPIDALIYTALVYLIAEKVEQYRIPPDREIVFSFRIRPNANGSMFDQSSSWKKFLQKTKELAESGRFEYVIKADITDFYNQIYTHRIRNLITDAGEGELDDIAEIVERFIMGLNKRTSRGIPTGPSASVVISELILADIDLKLLRLTDSYVRFVDDFYIFADTKESAINILHELTKYLYSQHRLVFSGAKTELITVDEYLAKYYLDEEAEEELQKQVEIDKRVEEFRDEMGIDDVDYLGPYEGSILSPSLQEIYDSVEKTDKLKILSSVYSSMLENILSNETLDYSMMRHILKKAAHYRIRSIANILFDSFDRLIPLTREYILYFFNVCNESFVQQNISKFENLWNNPYTKLPYVNKWLSYLWYSKISVYSTIITYDHIIDTCDKALLAKSINDRSWIRENKDSTELLGVWDRRAILFCSSILPCDELLPWAESVSATGGIIDRSIYLYLCGICA